MPKHTQTKIIAHHYFTSISIIIMDNGVSVCTGVSAPVCKQQE